jgi:hypothetical protein
MARLHQWRPRRQRANPVLGDAHAIHADARSLRQTP